MKIRFLCLLGLVTVMVSSYAPFARADEALQFDKSAAPAAPNVWMATDPIVPQAAPVATPAATSQGTPERTFIETIVDTAIQTAVGSNEDAAVIPVTVVPSSEVPSTAVSESPVSDKADVAASKEVPAPLSFRESAIVKKEPIAESPAPTSDKPAQAEPLEPAEPAQAGTIRPAEPVVPSQAPPTRKPSAARKPVELGFTLPPSEPLYEPERSMPHAPATAKTDDAVASGMLEGLFTGDVNSLVAKAVGSAEGTRTPTGDRTRAYYGHTDPGNQVWNRGSFSYQHSAKSPEDADQKQLQRLANQSLIIEARAADYGLHLTVEEKLNGIDLANQAPKAALDRGGYIDWLAKAKQRGMKGADAVLWARTRSFINPVTQRWDAPGLGNTAERIERDQARRMEAIARAIAANQEAVDEAVKVASSPAANFGENPANVAQVEQGAEAERGIAQVLAEKLVEMFGGDRVPESTPVAQEPVGIQQLFEFAL
jgi:hypothetical protein